MARKTKIERFNEKVLSRFQIYNSLFLTLPFKAIKQTSLLMPLFAEHCRIQYEKIQIQLRSLIHFLVNMHLI